MTAYARNRRPLWALRRSDRILITMFLASITVALAVGIVNYHQRTHLTVQGTETWYRGNEDDPDAPVMRFPRSVLELLDTTHPHLFFQSIMFFILCHVFSLSSVPERWKTAVYGAAFGSVVTEAGLPWLIRFVSGGFAPMLLASTTVMSATTLVLLAVPLHEMWRGGPRTTGAEAMAPPRRRPSARSRSAART